MLDGLHDLTDPTARRLAKHPDYSCHHCRNGRWCFLPLFWPFRAEAGRQLPTLEMSALVAAVRRSTRVLWALHVTLQEVKVFGILHSGCEAMTAAHSGSECPRGCPQHSARVL